MFSICFQIIFSKLYWMAFIFHLFRQWNSVNTWLHEKISFFHVPFGEIGTAKRKRNILSMITKTFWKSIENDDAFYLKLMSADSLESFISLKQYGLKRRTNFLHIELICIEATLCRLIPWVLVGTSHAQIFGYQYFWMEKFYLFY